MNNFEVIEFYTGKKVIFYTVKFTDLEKSETDGFVEKYDNIDDYSELCSDIVALIAEIGDRGALDYYFNRQENDFQALPNKENAKANFQGEHLRLYCMRISESIVILFNGGIKDEGTAQDSKCSIQFYEAHGYTKRISQALIDKEIEIQANKLISWNGTNEIIL